jgi:hypothetical protein
MQPFVPVEVLFKGRHVPQWASFRSVRGDRACTKASANPGVLANSRSDCLCLDRQTNLDGGIRPRGGQIGEMAIFVQLDDFRMDDLATTAAHPRLGSVQRAAKTSHL